MRDNRTAKKKLVLVAEIYIYARGGVDMAHTRAAFLFRCRGMCHRRGTEQRKLEEGGTPHLMEACQTSAALVSAFCPLLCPGAEMD